MFCKKLKSIKKNPVCSSMNEIKFGENGLAWLNPNNQYCFNYGWYNKQDFEDWYQGKGKIVKGDTDEEKVKYYELAVFEKKYPYATSIWYDYKFFDLIDENYSPESDRNNYSLNLKNIKPLKITKDNHVEIISKVLGNIIKYYADIHMIINEHNLAQMRTELSGARIALFSLGVGYMGACNTPQEITNLCWATDIARTKAIYLNYLKNNVKIPSLITENKL